MSGDKNAPPLLGPFVAGEALYIQEATEEQALHLHRP